jgi:hypothetical protein
MTHSTSTGAPLVPGEMATENPASLKEAGPSPELPAERSRFSNWLASFGLGETTIPLLRPLKTPRGGR